MEDQTEAGVAHFDWSQVRPVLDEALADSRADDREALLLRFLHGGELSHHARKAIPEARLQGRRDLIHVGSKLETAWCTGGKPGADGAAVKQNRPISEAIRGTQLGSIA
jgi:hypothetical protein